MEDTTAHICYLKHFDIFNAIPEEEMKSIASGMVGKSYEKGETIYTPHQEINSIYLLHRGEVVLYHSHEGKKETFDTIGPGTVFGNLNTQPTKPSHYAEATRGSEVCVFTVEDFVRVLSSKPDLMMKFIQTMADRLQDYEKRFKNSLHTAKEKIYGELKRLQEKKKKSMFGKFMATPLRLTHEEIATLTGLNRVTVTRTLKELREEGLISIDPKSGVIDLFEKN